MAAMVMVPLPGETHGLNQPSCANSLSETIPHTVTIPTINYEASQSASVVTPRDGDCVNSLVVSAQYPAPSSPVTKDSSQDSSDASESSPINAPSSPKAKKSSNGGTRLNKFVRRLHDMLQSEQRSGIVEWRRGLLVLHSTDAFAKTILPKYFNTRNFKTFRRQLNYYGFVHVRSFSTTGASTTALWVNRDLAKNGSCNISSVLLLRRVEPCESSKTAEGRRVRKELAVSTVEDDIGVSAKSLQLEQIRSLAMIGQFEDSTGEDDHILPPIPAVVHCRPPLLPRVTDDSESAANLLLMLSRSSASS